MVLQTHSLGSSNSTKTRYCKADKAEIMRRCTKSLIDSANYAKDLLPDFTFELKVLDDHSDQKSIDQLHSNLNSAKFKVDFEALSTKGIMPSILACYQYGKRYGKDWVYFVQDDYLYDTTAIYDMILLAEQASKNVGNYVSVFPFNDPYHYSPVNTAIQSHIIQAQDRYWRTQILTSSCFMIHHKILIKEWDLFDAMGKHEISPTMEDETINQLFRSRGYYLFIPIPSLALHMQFDTEKDPFINWREWWDRYDTVKMPPINKTKKNLLNVGFGGTSFIEHHYNTDLKDYVEITLDIDKKYNPDIVADIKDLTSIPSNSFDCIFASHVLEHVDYFTVPIILKEFVRLLTPEGFARIVVPNIKTVGINLLEDRMLDTLYESNSGPVTALDMLYSQKYYVRRNPSDFAIHKTGFTENIFNALSREFDLNLEVASHEFDLVVTLRK